MVAFRRSRWDTVLRHPPAGVDGRPGPAPKPAMTSTLDHTFAADTPVFLVVGPEAEPLVGDLQGALTTAGASVALAAPGKATETARQVAPDLVVLVAGMTSATALAALAEVGELAIVVVGFDDDDALRNDPFRFGAVAHLSRHRSPEELAQRIRDLRDEVAARPRSPEGEVGADDLEAFLTEVAASRRSGILTLETTAPPERQARVAFGEGRAAAQLVSEAMMRVRSLTRFSKVLRFRFDELPAGGLHFVDAATKAPRDPEALRLDGHRVILGDEDGRRSHSIAAHLRSIGATALVTDLSGRGLSRASHVDPTVVIVGEEELRGSGYDLLRRVRSDRRLRWAALLVVRWNAVWSHATPKRALARVAAGLSAVPRPEQRLAEAAETADPFEARLEAAGPARVLRALDGAGQDLRLAAVGPEGAVTLELAGGMIIAATARRRGDDGPTLEGEDALDAWLDLTGGRLRVEPLTQPRPTSMVGPVDAALGALDSGAASSLRPSSPSIPAPSTPAPAGAAASAGAPRPSRPDLPAAGAPPPPPGAGPATTRGKRPRQATLLGMPLAAGSGTTPRLGEAPTNPRGPGLTPGGAPPQGGYGDLGDDEGPTVAVPFPAEAAGAGTEEIALPDELGAPPPPPPGARTPRRQPAASPKATLLGIRPDPGGDDEFSSEEPTVWGQRPSLGESRRTPDPASGGLPEVPRDLGRDAPAAPAPPGGGAPPRPAAAMPVPPPSVPLSRTSLPPPRPSIPVSEAPTRLAQLDELRGGQPPAPRPRSQTPTRFAPTNDLAQQAGLGGAEASDPVGFTAGRNTPTRLAKGGELPIEETSDAAQGFGSPGRQTPTRMAPADALPRPDDAGGGLGPGRHTPTRLAKGGELPLDDPAHPMDPGPNRDPAGAAPTAGAPTEDTVMLGRGPARGARNDLPPLAPTAAGDAGSLPRSALELTGGSDDEATRPPGGRLVTASEGGEDATGSPPASVNVWEDDLEDGGALGAASPSLVARRERRVGLAAKAGFAGMGVLLLGMGGWWAWTWFAQAPDDQAYQAFLEAGQGPAGKTAAPAPPSSASAPAAGGADDPGGAAEDRAGTAEASPESGEPTLEADDDDAAGSVDDADDGTDPEAAGDETSPAGSDAAAVAAVAADLADDAPPGLAPLVADLAVAELPEVPDSVERMSPGRRAGRARRYRSRGWRALKRGRYEIAERAYNRALVYGPESSVSSRGLALVYFRMEDYEQSLRWVRRSLTTDGDNLTTLLLLGEIRESQGDPDAARKVYELLRETNPRNRTVRRRLRDLDEADGTR